MQTKVSISNIRDRIINMLNNLPDEVDAYILPIIVYTTTFTKKYGIRVDRLGYNKGGFYAIKLAEDLILLIYNDEIRTKTRRTK